MSAAPYPGLRPFEREENPLFFGREEQVDQLLDKLGESHLLAVLGLSGSGKSSLVRAGLLPALEGGALAGAGAHWQVAELRPGDRPFHRLAAALCRDTPWGRAGGEGPEALEEKLRRGPRALHWLLGVRPLAPGHRLLLLVDQFEELFRYRPDRGKAEEAAAFVALLLGAAAHPDCYVAITLRSEFLGECGAYPGLPEAINAGLFLTPALTPEQMADAIQLPPRLPQFDGEVEQELVRRLLAEAAGVADPLPLLQHALLRLWSLDNGDKRLTLKEFEALGDLRQVLNGHLEEAFGELTEGQQRIAETMFRALVEPGAGERDTRRPVTVAEVAALAGVEAEAVIAVAEPFRRAGRSFLLPAAGRGLEAGTTLDLAHEALIRQWRRLREWSADELEQAKLYRRLEEAARRHLEGREAFWVDPGLQIALDWREEKMPTAEWVKRYGGNFAQAMGFLNDSREARAAKQREEEERRRRELRRTRAVALGSLLALLVTLGLAGWAVVERGHAVESERHAAGQRERAEQNAAEAERQRGMAEQAEQARTAALFDSGLTHAALLARVEDPQEALAVLRKTAELDPAIPADRRHARNLLAGYGELLGGAAERVYEGAGAVLQKVVLSPDGRLLAAAGERGALLLFDTASGAVVRRLEGHDPEAGETGSVRALALSPDGRLLYSAGDDGRILRWSLPAGERVGEAWRAAAEVWALALSPDGKTLASGNRDKGITLRSTADGKVLRTLKGRSSNVANGNPLAFTPEGLLVSGGFNGEVGLWDPADGSEESLPRIHSGQVNAVTVSPDGRYLATGGADKRIVLWQLEGKEARPLRLLQGHTNMVVGLRFTPGGRLLSASYDNTLRLWDLASGATLRIYQGHTAGLWSIAIHDGEIYTAANDGTVRRWPLATPRQWLWGLPGEPISAAIAPDGAFVSVGFADGALRLYPLPATGEGAPPGPLVELPQAHGKQIIRQAFSPDGTLLATASLDRTAKLWRLDRGGPTLTPLHTLEGHTDAVYAVAFSPRTAAPSPPPATTGRWGSSTWRAGRGGCSRPMRAGSPTSPSTEAGSGC